MYKEPLRSDSLRRQRHIVDCFARLLEATPYPGLTVRQVCTAAGISRTVFYRYFESKEDLADALVDRLVLELLEAGDAIPDLLASRLNTLGWFRFWQPRAERMRTLARSGLAGRLTDALLALVQRESLDPLAKRMTGAGYAMLCVRVRTAFYLIFSMTDHWVRTGLEETPENMAVFCNAFLHRPLLGN